MIASASPMPPASKPAALLIAELTTAIARNEFPVFCVSTVKAMLESTSESKSGALVDSRAAINLVLAFASLFSSSWAWLDRVFLGVNEARIATAAITNPSNELADDVNDE